MASTWISSITYNQYHACIGYNSASDSLVVSSIHHSHQVPNNSIQDRIDELITKSIDINIITRSPQATISFSHIEVLAYASESAHIDH